LKPWATKRWWWPRSGRRRCGLGADVRTVRLTIGPHVVSHFSELSKLAESYKVKKTALSFSKNFQFLNEASLEYSEQLFKLCQLQIPHRDRVKNPGTDSIFESLMNFKRDWNLLEKSDKFSKIPSWLDLHKSEFSWIHLYIRFRVTKQVPNDLVRIKGKSLNLKFKPYNI
jgi:hypothetical protein